MAAWNSNRRPPKLSDVRNILATDNFTEDVKLLTKGPEGLILTNLIEWDDDEAYKKDNFNFYIMCWSSHK